MAFFCQGRSSIIIAMATVLFMQDLIASFSLPDGWREFEVPDQGFTQATVREFRPAESVNDAVSMCVYNRGLAMDDGSASCFRSLITAPSHHLTPAEIGQQEELLKEAADSDRFSMLDARTEEINGRKALVIEGRWIKSQTDMIRIYLDIRGDGRFVQELFFSAPRADYESHIRQMRACFKSIKWKS